MSSRMIGWYGDGNGYVGNLDLKPEARQHRSAPRWRCSSGEHGRGRCKICALLHPVQRLYRCR